MPLPTVKSIYVGLMFSYLFFYVRKSIGRGRRKLWTSVYATFLRGCDLCDYRGQWVIGLTSYPMLCRPCRALTAERRDLRTFELRMKSKDLTEWRSKPERS